MFGWHIETPSPRRERFHDGRASTGFKTWYMQHIKEEYLSVVADIIACEHASDSPGMMRAARQIFWASHRRHGNNELVVAPIGWADIVAGNTIGIIAAACRRVGGRAAAALGAGLAGSPLVRISHPHAP
jgi:hypothetical protein